MHTEFSPPNEWRDDAACKDSDIDFFPTGPYDSPERRQSEMEALTVCASCPVRRECRAWAMGAPEIYGVWGGLTEQERRAVVGVG